MEAFGAASGETEGQSLLQQNLVRLYQATYRAGCRLRLPLEESKDTAMQSVENYFTEWVQEARAQSLEWEPDSAPLLSEEQIRRRAMAAARDAARRYRRDHTYTAERSGSDAEGAQPYADLADPRISAQAQIQEQEFLQTVAAILARLPGETGSQFWEHHVCRMSFVELGQQYDCTAVAIRLRLLRALPHIREELARRGWDETGAA